MSVIDSTFWQAEHAERKKAFRCSQGHLMDIMPCQTIEDEEGAYQHIR